MAGSGRWRREGEGRRGRRAREPLGVEQLAAAILGELRRLGRELGERQGWARDEAPGVDEMALALTVPLTDGGRVPELARELVADFERRLGAALQHRRGFRPGQIYCFHCDQPGCDHSRPGQPTEVFAGYSPTGRPVWKPFVTLCLERGEPRVDQLFGGAPQVIAMAQTGQDLTAELLSGFGRDSLAFDVVGQVVAGLVPKSLGLGPIRADSDRVALTFQVVQVRSGESELRLRTNLIGLSVDDLAQAAARGGSRGVAERLRVALGAARVRIERLGPRLAASERRGQPVDACWATQPVLRRLQAEIENVFRLQTRRTVHAERRRLGGERPTSAAVQDARGASDERLLFDVERNTVVVLAPYSRAHVFSVQGRHVTSLQLEPGELERKLGRKRWEPLGREQRESFRRALGGR
ncbi:MAG: hypothetical protein HY744_15905 [Deltaproteobacteria bacterium]|nr:hypothetical protein [Deltaproteobacteria bacterium]